MKKTYLLMAALLLIMGRMAAQNTLTVENFTLPQNGGNIEMSLTLDEADKYTSYQFKILTPAGVGYVVDSENDVECVLGTGHDVTHGATAHWNAGDKMLNVGVASTKSALFNGQSLKLQIPLAATTAEIGTEFVFTVKDIAFIDKNGVKSYLDNVSFTATVGTAEVKRTILDETSTTAPAASSGEVNVRVKRTINANEWSTICLPFAMTAAQVQTAFGNDVQLGDFKGYDTVEDGGKVVGLKVKFDKVTAIAANHPYVIKVSGGINEFTADNVTIAPVEEPCVEYDNGQTGKKRVVWGTFTGTYVADYVIPYSGEDVSLFLSGNQLYYASVKTKHMKAYRACFWFSDILTTTGDASAPITMSFNDATGINASMNNQGVKNEGWYTIGGVKLSAEPTKKGLYIHNGNKEVIK